MNLFTAATAFLDVTGGLDSGNNWVYGSDMGIKMSGHCSAGIDENRALMMGGKWRDAANSVQSSRTKTTLYDMSGGPL